jgi:hypothetical protein
LSRASRRYYRTILLGILALGTLVWVAVDQFGVPPGDMADLFLATLLVVSLVIGAAALVALLWVGLRRLRQRR